MCSIKLYEAHLALTEFDGFKYCPQDFLHLTKKKSNLDFVENVFNNQLYEHFSFQCRYLITFFLLVFVHKECIGMKM